MLKCWTGSTTSSGNFVGSDRALAFGFHSKQHVPGGGNSSGWGEAVRNCSACSHPQRNLPRQTRTRSDASAMQNSCQVNQGEQHRPCLPFCGEPAELITAFFPLSRTPIKRVMESCVMGKLLGPVVQGAQSNRFPLKSQASPV